VLKGPLATNRGDIIQRAYEVLHERFQGETTFENLVKAFNAKHHPDVVRMVKNEREAFKEFADNWGIKEGDRVVTFEDFYAYYSDLSACIDRDEEFEKILKSTWQFK